MSQTSESMNRRGGSESSALPGLVAMELKSGVGEEVGPEF